MLIKIILIVIIRINKLIMLIYLNLKINIKFLNFLFNYHLLIYKNNINNKCKYKWVNYVNLLKL